MSQWHTRAFTTSAKNITHEIIDVQEGKEHDHPARRPEG